MDFLQIARPTLPKQIEIKGIRGPHYREQDNGLCNTPSKATTSIQAFKVGIAQRKVKGTGSYEVPSALASPLPFIVA